MKKTSRLVAVVLIFALLIPSISVCAAASDIDGNEVSMTLYVPADQLEEFEAGFDYDTKTIYAAEDGIAPHTDYTYNIGAYKTSTYSFGTVPYGTTMYMRCNSTQGMTFTLLYGKSSASCSNTAFKTSTRVLDRTYAGDGSYYKLSMYNEAGSTATVYLTVYTY